MTIIISNITIWILYSKFTSNKLYVICLCLILNNAYIILFTYTNISTMIYTQQYTNKKGAQGIVLVSNRQWGIFEQSSLNHTRYLGLCLFNGFTFTCHLVGHFSCRPTHASFYRHFPFLIPRVPLYKIKEM